MKLELSPHGGLVGRQQRLFVFVGPAGAGKNRIITPLLDLLPGLELPISTTTRAPRTREVHEKHGVHYYFVEKAEFERRIADGELLEHACNHGNYYGLERGEVERVFANGNDGIRDVSIDGAINLKRALPGQVVAIFVLPLEFAQLRERMIRRGTDDPTELNTRTNTALAEVKRITGENVADYLIVNDQKHTAIGAAKAIINAERARFDVQSFDAAAYLGEIV